MRIGYLHWILALLVAGCADPGSVYIGFLDSHDQAIFRDALRVEEIPEANEETLIIAHGMLGQTENAGHPWLPWLCAVLPPYGDQAVGSGAACGAPTSGNTTSATTTAAV